MNRGKRTLGAAALVVLGGLLLWLTSCDKGSPSPTKSGSALVALSSLPQQAQETARLIQEGGPFPYPRNDGVTFHNNEGHLPHETDGYYREYTVKTPGASNRGPRRIIVGKNGEWYYTADHYETFVRVDINR